MLKNEIYTELAKIGCILTGKFRLSSGKMSPYYIDLRKVPSYPDLFDKVTDAYVCKIRKLGDFQRIAGIATAGIPIATLVAHKLRKPFFYIRKEKKAHGTKSEVEGELRSGETVILIDDVATTGESLLKAIETIRKRGGIVKYAVVLIDREEGAEKNLKNEEVILVSLIKASEMFSKLYSLGCIEKEDYESVMKYLGGKRCLRDGT